MNNPTPCDRCGQPHPKCAAHKRDGSPCGQRQMRGQTVCKMHGGSKPAARANGARRLAARAAEQAVATYGLPREIAPETALLEEVHRTAGHVAWLGQVVTGLDRGDLVWGVTRDKLGGDDHGRTFEAEPSVWLELYQRERKHLVDVCRAATAAGIEERRVRLAEQQGELLAGVIRRVFDALDLTEQQQARAPGVVARELRAVGEIEGGAG